MRRFVMQETAHFLLPTKNIKIIEELNFFTSLHELYDMLFSILLCHDYSTNDFQVYRIYSREGSHRIL